MGRQAGFRSQRGQLLDVVWKQVQEPDRYGSETHDATVTARAFGWIARRACISVSQEASQSGACRIADIEAGSIYRVLAIPPLADVPPCLIMEVPTCTDNAVSHCEGHASVVGPLARLQAVGTSSAIVGHRRKTPRSLEFDGSPQGVTNCQSEQCSAMSIDCVHSSKAPLTECAYMSLDHVIRGVVARAPNTLARGPN